VLLDTHVWIWSLLDPARISRKVARLLRIPESELWLSPISAWETLLLIERGRLRVEDDPGDWLHDALSRGPLREAPLTHEIAVESRRIRLPHDDPADRFLAATAKVLDLTLVTADARLRRCRDIEVLWSGPARPGSAR
jgi:PIN domain nuclease of toxin-antitoxin system